MRYLRKFNEENSNNKLYTTLDLVGGENIFDMKMIELPKDVLNSFPDLDDYIPTLGEFLTKKDIHKLFISCNDGETVYYSDAEGGKMYSKEEFDVKFFEYDDMMDRYNTLVDENTKEGSKILSVVKRYFECENLKVYIND